MPDNDALADRRRAAEEDYFRKKDRELIAKMREAAAADQARRDLGSKTGVTDPELLRDLHELGFTPDTLSLLPLVPIVQVAWADGSITPAERALIVKFARERGISTGTAADAQLSEWVARRPAADVFTRAMRLIRAMLATSSDPSRDVGADDVVRYAETIASASGGLLGIGSITAEERAVLQQIAKQLKEPRR